MIDLFGKKDWKKYLKQIKVCAIGPVTARTLRGFGIKPDIMPQEYTVKSMVEAMESYFKNQNSNIKMQNDNAKLKDL